MICPESVASRRPFMIAKCLMSDDPRLPVHTTADEHFTAPWEMLKYLHKRYVECTGNELGSTMQQAVQVVALKGEEPEIGESLALHF